MSNIKILTKMRLQFGELEITPRVVERLDELGFTADELQDAVNEHKSSCDGDEPSVYVGTYAKYNDGSLRGLWIDLSTFDCYDDFITFCQAIHADEEDPELMAQDYENFPREWYNEGFMSENDFDNIMEFVELSDKHSRAAVEDYMEFNDSLSDFEEAYCGEWNSEEDFARHFVNECYDIERMMGNLANYFYYEAYGRELFMYDYNMGANGHVFRRI